MNKFFLKIILVKMIGCCFAVFVYGRFSSFSDADRYVNASLEGISLHDLLDRTLLTDTIFATLSIFFGKSDLMHFVVAFLVGVAIFLLFRYYSRFVPRVFWIVLALPMTAIWTGVVGKEALAFCAFLAISKWIAEVVVNGKSNPFLLLCGVVMGVIMRPHYFVAYFFAILMVYLFQYKKNIKIKNVNFSSGVNFIVLLYFSAVFFAAVAMTRLFWEPHLLELMKISERYFLSYDGNANRYWISWGSTSDFFSNMWWGVPFSLIGPMPGEVTERIAFLPFFIEGFAFLFLIGYFLSLIYKMGKKNPRIEFFFFYAFVPASVGAMLIHYPFGVFNPGSALRYKQSLVPLFFFLPIFLMVSTKKLDIGGKSA